jgi:diguanylate cyclase (GGDEF)-like protein
MRLSGRLSGVLSVGYTKPSIVTGEHLALLGAFGELAAAASRNANAAAGLAHAARSDSLTGCLNHAAFHEQVRAELERSQRTKQRVSVAMLDLDDFKRMNEEHGHPMGDDVLRRVAGALRESVRGYDRVGRYGGDEFAVVVPEASETEAAELATRAIGAIEFALADLPGSNRATAGVAEWDGLESASELIDRADRALLSGKHHGGRGTAVRATAAQAADNEPR